MALTKVTDSIIDFDNLEILTSASDTGVDLTLNGNKSSNGAVASIIFENNTDSVAMIRASRVGGNNDAADLQFFTQATGGSNSEAMRIDSSGNLLVGGTSASATVLDGTGAAGCVYIGNSSALYPVLALESSQRSHLLYQDSSGNLQIYDSTSNDVRLKIDTSGNVAIGGTSASNKFQVNGGTYSGYVAYLANSGTGGGNHGMYIDNGSTSSYLGIWRSNSVTRFYVDGSGNYYFSGSNQSDRNKKENITDLTDNALDLVTQLQPKKYNYIGSDIDKAGFIAQDMETVIPRLVSGNAFDADASDDIATNPTGKGIDYMGYTAYLTKAIQELKTELDAAKARIETLENA